MLSLNKENALPPETLQAMTDVQLQQLAASVIKEYTSRLNSNPSLMPFVDSASVTATEAVIAVTRILKQVNVEVFELSMWQSMGSIR